MRKIFLASIFIAAQVLAQGPVGPPSGGIKGVQSFTFSNANGIQGSVTDPTRNVILSIQIANNAISLAQMTNIGTGTVIGRKSAGTGVPELLSGSDVLNLIGTTRGSILYRGASGWAILTPGTSGYIFTSAGAGADPTYVADANEKTANKNQNNGYLGLDSGGLVPNNKLQATVELTTNKGAVSGYAPLGANQRVPQTNLGSGSAGGGSKALFDDQTYKSVAGGGSIVDVAIATANGISGTSDHDPTTPTITLTLGAITPTTIVASGAISGSNLSGTNTGDQTITLTGDATGTGTGSFATTIAANAVTYAKFQQVNALSLVGNPTGSLANATNITIGGGGQLAGGVLKFYNAAISLSGASPHADAAAGKSFYITLSADATFTFDNFGDGDTILIRCQQASSGGPWNVTFPTATWGGGSPPTEVTTASKSNLFFFHKQNTTIYARADTAAY